MPSTILSALVEASNPKDFSSFSKLKHLERQDVPGLSSNSRVAVVNLTPYDGALEKACLKSAVECGPRTALLHLPAVGNPSALKHVALHQDAVVLLRGRLLDGQVRRKDGGTVLA